MLFDLSEQELHILDEFEDVEYIKSIVAPLILVPPGNLSICPEICNLHENVVLLSKSIGNAACWNLSSIASWCCFTIMIPSFDV